MLPGRSDKIVGSGILVENGIVWCTLGGKKNGKPKPEYVKTIPGGPNNEQSTYECKKGYDVVRGL